jgi:protein-serine/threonine kinase
MAPEVLRGASYDGRCDWWSIGIILFECLYGHTPFYSEEGREKTKQNILNHQTTFRFPARPPATDRCKDLIHRLIQEPERRLSSYRYHVKDQGLHTSRAPGCSMPPTPCPYVFPDDADDIKAHR